jgi:hypothetical protein
MQQINNSCLADYIKYLQSFCGGFVWSEVETTERALPQYAKYVDTFYNINVYFDAVTETFFFSEFN